MVWLVEIFGSVEQPLEYRNRETGEVIRKVSFTYHSDVWNAPQTVYFTIYIQARDNRSRITITKISKRDGVYKSEYEDVKNAFALVIDEYEAYIIARSLDEW